MPKAADLPLDRSYTLNVLKRRNNIPTEFEISNGKISYSGACWTCDYCYGSNMSNWGGGTVKQPDPWCSTGMLSTYCSNFANTGNECTEVVVTAPRPPGNNPAGPRNPTVPTPPTNIPPTGGPGNSDNDGDDDDHDEGCNDFQKGLANEYKNYNSRYDGSRWSYGCGNFDKEDPDASPKFIVFGKDGYDEKTHGGYGLVSGGLFNLYRMTSAWLDARGIPDSTITINSGYRHPLGNASIGGATRSRHLCGHAADIQSDDPDWTHDVRTNLVRSIKSNMARKSESYVGGNYVHIDTSPCLRSSWPK